MVWFYDELDPLPPAGSAALPLPPPPPAPARGGDAPACGKVMLANQGYVLSSDASVVDWLNQVPGSRQHPVASSDVRRSNASSSS